MANFFLAVSAGILPFRTVTALWTGYSPLGLARPGLHMCWRVVSLFLQFPLGVAGHGFTSCGGNCHVWSLCFMLLGICDTGGRLARCRTAFS